ncbi:SGNH/GDSL hydrolase family protein [Archangium primigenium]|uniref:SGNH/GDSL hydrolase family protein n=1 Tax=[Archangium] primigenium TaxID=2792470 RepID=UPI001959714D|nr:SGNH/GDSL hydrolase family protein [Archangium primigenium]MBM7112566.1 SGNH/GDSL hydrolase family protein [Archangium primigenium]
MKTLSRLSLATALVCLTACERPSVEEFLPPSPAQSQTPLEGFDPLPRGFEWALAERFPVDRDGDGVRDFREDIAYVRPQSFDVTLEGCPASDPGYTYQWHVQGERSSFDTWQVSYLDRGCRVPAVFPGQGAYRVTLTVSSPSASRQYTQKVTIKDWLIVGLGDSFGSGEGNPDLPGDYPNDVPARWADARCHRSFKAPSALVAQRLETSDPHTSVTYVSLACSGANISRDGLKLNHPNPYQSWMGTLLEPDSSAGPILHLGSGLLGDYVGIEPAAPRLPAQVDRLKELVGGRRIDAMLLSAGGNDAGFGDVLTHCTITSTCSGVNDSDGDRLRAFVGRRFDELPGRYRALGDRLAQLFPSSPVYLTEYPDLSRDAAGVTCEQIMHNVGPVDGIRRSQGEPQWIQAHFLAPLNQQMRDSVLEQQNASRPWHYVGGVEDAFRTHGMCAGDQRWFRVPPEARDLQGPKDDTQNTKGMAHPNEEGLRQYARLIRASLTRRFGEHPYYPDGTLLREPSGGIYVTQGFGRFWVPDNAELQGLLARLGSSAASIVQLTAEQMAEVPFTPRDGTFLHLPSGLVQVVYGGAAFDVPNPEELSRLLGLLGVDDSAVGPVPSGTTHHLRPVPRDGTVLQEGDFVGYMHRGALVHVTDPRQLHELGIDPEHVRPLPTGGLLHLPSPPSTSSGAPLRLSPRDNTFVQHGQGISLVLGGTPFLVPDMGEFDALRGALGDPGAPAHLLPGAPSLLLPDRARDNLLLKELHNDAVYILQSGSAYSIATPAHLTQLREQLPIEDRAVHLIPTGALGPLTTRVPRNHSLLREADASEVYLLLGGVKYHMHTETEMLRVGVDPARVRLVPPGGLARYPTGPDTRLVGFIDSIQGSGEVLGWGLDLDAASNPLQIRFYADGPENQGVLLGEVTTTLPRQDVNDHFRALEAMGTHGFSFTLPASYRDGRPHVLHAYVMDAQRRVQLPRPLPPQTFQLF